MRKKNRKSDGLAAEEIIERVFAMSDDIRYVALYHYGKLHSVSKPTPARASSWESDKYEEIIVNPTLVTLLRQRGNIDCGGIRYVVIRYGRFTQLVCPIRGGHISVAFEVGSDYERLLPRIKRVLRAAKLAIPE